MFYLWLSYDWLKTGIGYPVLEKYRLAALGHPTADSLSQSHPGPADDLFLQASRSLNSQRLMLLIKGHQGTSFGLEHRYSVCKDLTQYVFQVEG